VTDLRASLGGALMAAAFVPWTSPPAASGPQERAAFLASLPFEARAPNGSRSRITFHADGRIESEPLGPGGSAAKQGSWRLADSGHCIRWRDRDETCFTWERVGGNAWSVRRDFDEVEVYTRDPGAPAPPATVGITLQPEGSVRCAEAWFDASVATFTVVPGEERLFLDDSEVDAFLNKAASYILTFCAGQSGRPRSMNIGLDAKGRGQIRSEFTARYSNFEWKINNTIQDFGPMMLPCRACCRCREGSASGRP